MSAIFLSYRRDDSSGYAGRLFDNLAERFGRERLFMDIETLEPGMDFVAGIDRAIESCGAVIAIIGPNWIKAQDSEGRRRLDNPHDFIRLEITAALTRDVRVIPVLVHDASMPPEQELPEPLRPLCRLQACEISDNRWEFDVRRLADVLEPLITEPEQRPAAELAAGAAQADTTDTTPAPEPTVGGGPGRWLAAVAAVVLAIGGGAWWLSQSTSTEQTPTPVDRPGPVASQAGTPSETVAARVPLPPDEPPAQASPEPLPASKPAEPEPVAAPEPRGPSPDDTRQDEIAELIHAAEIDLAELRLTRPAGNNAFERYRRVLELEPHNPAARQGLVAIAERYRGLIEEALGRGSPDRAQRHLDSARAVDPGADWLTGAQREIDQRRHLAARPDTPEPAPGAEQAERQACLAACERDHQACRAEIEARTEADCLRSRTQECEQRYQSCMSDTSKLFMGTVALESQCAGVHAQCRRSVAEDCAAAPQIAEQRCATRLDTCVDRCRSAQ